MAERSQNSWYRDQDRKIQRIGARTSSQQWWMQMENNLTGYVVFAGILKQGKSQIHHHSITKHRLSWRSLYHTNILKKKSWKNGSLGLF